MENSTPNIWLQTALERLNTDRFTVQEGPDLKGFQAIAHRSGYECLKGVNCEYFFFFAETDHLGTDEVEAFSALALEMAKRHRKVMLPCGFGEALFVFPVAIVTSLDDEAAQLVRKFESRNRLTAIETPVVYEKHSGCLHYPKLTSPWFPFGGDFLQDMINQYLGDIRH
jgi:hypothetical protein